MLLLVDYKQNQDINTIFASIDTIILWLITIYSGHALFTYFGEYMMASIGSKTVLALRTRMSTHYIHYLSDTFTITNGAIY